MATKDLKAKNWDILIKWLSAQKWDELDTYQIVSLISSLNKKVVENYLQKET